MKCYYLDTTLRYVIPVTLRGTTNIVDTRGNPWVYGPIDTAQPAIADYTSAGWSCLYDSVHQTLTLSFPAGYQGSTFIYLPDSGDSNTPNLLLPVQVLAYNTPPGSGFMGASAWLLISDDLMSGFTPLVSPPGASAPTPPPPPTLTITAGNLSADLTWTTYSGATTYDVTRSTNSDGASGIVVATDLTSLTYTDSGLANGTTYYYSVTALSAGAILSQSLFIAATPHAPAPPTAALFQPTTGATTSVPRRQVLVSLGAELTISTTTTFAPPPSVTLTPSTAQLAALGIGTVTARAGLTVLTGAKFQIPETDPRALDAAACCARTTFRLDDNGTIQVYLCPGPITDMTAMPALYEDGVPKLAAGTWFVWAMLILSVYSW